jgi:hypothetical protein
MSGTEWNGLGGLIGGLIALAAGTLVLRNRARVAPALELPRKVYPFDSRIPPYESWPERGISGVIGVGPDAGKPVLVDRIAKTKDLFFIVLPSLRLELGGHWMESGAVDGPRRDGKGGLLDYLTTKWDVKWSLDPQDYDNASLYWGKRSLWRAPDEPNEDR